MERPAPAEGTAPSLARGLHCHTSTIHVATIPCTFPSPYMGKTSPEHLDDPEPQGQFCGQSWGSKTQPAIWVPSAAELSPDAWFSGFNVLWSS